jgi:hypothetical protein
MSDVAIARERFLEVLASIAAGSDRPDALTDKLRAALLDFASETPDNRSAAERLEVGLVGSTVGPKLAGRSMLMSDVAHAVEDLPVPGALKRSFPDLSEQDWDAFTRLTTLLYTVLSRRLSTRP